MPNAFDAHNPPFDRLTHQEIEELRASIDIGYFRPNEVIIPQGAGSELLYVIIKGSVEERHDDAVQALFEVKDSFDARAVVHGAAGGSFVAAEETLCYLIPRPVILSLVKRNVAFAAFFYAEISRKLDAMAATQTGADGFESVLRARIEDARFAPAVFVEGGATIAETGRLMSERNTNALFVRDGERMGVVTGMNLSKAVILRRLGLDTPVREVAHFDVVTADTGDFIFEALLLMTRHNKRRLAIRTGEAYVGFLEDIDILGLFAGNSQLIPGRIDRAGSLDDLATAARDIEAQVERLHRQGTKVEVIAEITSDLNRRLYAKLFRLVAPPSIQEAGCLFVMGSEGRGEQTVRTDQDNGLLLARALPEAEVAAFRTAFSGELARFGFPLCRGGVMVSNPVWSQPVDSFLAQLRSWAATPSETNTMNLGIFFDAVAVSGRQDILAEAKTYLITMLRGESAYLAHFASLMEKFQGFNIGVLSNLLATVGVGSDIIDIKKVGTFPIVHGVRALAIDLGITAPSTAARIEGAAEAGVLEQEFARELISALRVFMEFRMRTQLEALRLGKPEEESIVRLGELSPTDRDILRDALRITKRYRELMRHRYHLDQL